MPQTRAKKTEPVSDISKETTVNLRPGTTVAVVAYNHGDFIVECLQSIRTQSRKAARVLIADDNSPDNTREIIEEYCRQYPDFAEFYPNHENIGLNRTLNKMLDLTGTEFFTYISADDFMLPQRIERQEELLRSNPAVALCYSDAIVINESSQVNSDPSSIEHPWPDNESDLIRPFAALLKSNWIPAASIFLRTEVLRASGGYNENLFYEDFEILTRLSKDHSFQYTRTPLVAVRRLSTSLGTTGFARSNPRFIHALAAAYSHYETAPTELAKESYSMRWELAKRSIDTAMSRLDSLRLILSSRQGAERRLSVPFQLLRLAVSAVRKPNKA